MNIDAKKFFFSFFFFIITIAGIGYHYFDREKNAINQNFNTTLQRTATAAEAIIGDHYHDRIYMVHPTAAEDANTVNTLTTLANAEGVAHIYSLIQGPQKTLHYASSSLHQSKLSSGQTIRFYDLHPHSTSIQKAFDSRKTILDIQKGSDDRESIRTIYVPHTTHSGHRYLIGVEMEVGAINKLSNAAAFGSIASSLLIFLGIFPFFLLYRNMLKNSNKILKERVELATNELREINEKLDEKVKEKTRALTENLYHDQLTSLPNRLKLHEDLAKHANSTVALFNVDDFKEINDLFGIDTGDEILKEIALWLKEMRVKPYRIGGDEYAIVFPDKLSPEQIEVTLISLLRTFGEKNFIIGDEIIHLRATMGVAIKSHKPLTHADVALNKARRTKRSYSIYDSNEGIENQYKINIAMSAQIRQAIAEHRIVCHYQPIANCKTGTIEKYETLVRILRDDGTLIKPDDFLSIAKKAKLYSTITQEVIYQACHTFSNRTEDFSINLSITDIVDPNVITNIERIVKQTGTQNRIIFEILESEGIENYDEVQSFINRVKRFGAKIAIDDFGSGYSNFENIIKLNVDFLKIDGSLIHNIDKDPRHKIIVESIVDFTDRIGIKTIAEYVATEPILKIVTESGVTYAQGYFIGKPKPF